PPAAAGRGPDTNARLQSSRRCCGGGLPRAAAASRYRGVWYGVSRMPYVYPILGERICQLSLSPVVRKNSFLIPLDDIPSTCNNKDEGTSLPVGEGPIGYDTMPALAPHAGPVHRHALDTVGR